MSEIVVGGITIKYDKSLDIYTLEKGGEVMQISKYDFEELLKNYFNANF